MAKRACERCGGDLPLLARADARFCSTRCRVAAHRARQAPAELRERDRWVRHDTRKVPLRADGFGPASSTDPQTWSTYKAVRTSGRGVGDGFVLNGDGVVCIDLDHCVTPSGRITAAARRFLATLPSTYVERSPSGTGLHVWGFGQAPRGRRMVVGGLHVEVYGTGRYMTVTCDPVQRAPFADLSSVVEALTN